MTPRSRPPSPLAALYASLDVIEKRPGLGWSVHGHHFDNGNAARQSAAARRELTESILCDLYGDADFQRLMLHNEAAAIHPIMRFVDRLWLP